MLRRALLLMLFTMPLFANGLPGLYFREDWAATPPSIPVTQEHVVNKELDLELHGPGKSVIKKSFHEWVPNDPHYIWSGLCPMNWAVSLGKADSFVDLTNGRIRWRAKQAGFRRLRMILKTAEGQWLVSEAFDGPSDDWREREFVIKNTRWRALDIETVIEGKWSENPDLARVERVGFTDLMPGGRSAACSRLDWIEVYGSAVGR